MGKASSSKKVARAARAAGRPGVRRNYTWPAVLSVVVVLGIAGVAVSRGSGGTGSGSGSPKIGEHVHEAYGIDLCGTWAANLPDQMRGGLHTHADGLIHIEPSTYQDAGTNANLGRFVKIGGSGLVASQSEIKLPGSKTTYKDGGKCGAKKASVRVYVWKNVTSRPKLVTRSLDRIHLEDNAVIVLAYLPEGQTPSLPPSVSNLTNPGSSEGAGGTQTTLTVPATSSTAPPQGSSSSTSGPTSSSTP